MLRQWPRSPRTRAVLGVLCSTWEKIAKGERRNKPQLPFTHQPLSPTDPDAADGPPPLPTTPGAGRLDPADLLPDRAVAGVVASLDPTARLAPDAAAALGRVAADFVAAVLDAALAATAARRGDVLTASDVAAAAAVGWNARAPGGGPDTVRPYRRRPPSAAHAARAAAVARAVDEK